MLPENGVRDGMPYRTAPPRIAADGRKDLGRSYFQPADFITALQHGSDVEAHSTVTDFARLRG